MSPADWCFIEHNIQRNAATRKLVRATVARNHHAKERARVRCDSLKEQSDPHRLCSNEQDEMEDLRSGEQTVGTRQQSKGRRKSSAVSPRGGRSDSFGRMLESVDLDLFSVGVPATAYQPEYRSLFEHCKL